MKQIEKFYKSFHWNYYTEWFDTMLLFQNPKDFHVASVCDKGETLTYSGDISFLRKGKVNLLNIQDNIILKYIPPYALETPKNYLRSPYNIIYRKKR